MEGVKKQLGNYRVTRLIGTGAFADIYQGTHLYLNSHVAIKVPRGPFAGLDLESFLAEARLLINLVHPHIIRLIDCGIEADTPYLVMDYAPGGNLRQLHPPGSVVPLTTVVDYVSAIASALQYAHRQHVIHRDLKPENLLLGPTHELLLSDFGLAVIFPDVTPLQVQERFGTLEYMSPEQIRGQALPASDQYALAAMVYEWLSGQRLFRGTHAALINQHLYSAPSSFWEQHPDLSPAIEEVLFKALAKDPALRYVDVLSFACAFEEASHTSVRVPWEPGGDPALVRGEQRRYNNLPHLLTRLIGREQELAAARNLLLRPDIRLLTLTGTPGVGKTRLALALGADVVEAHTHGVCYVQLASVSDPDLVGPTIAHTLGVPERANRSLVEQLKDFLRDKQLLLLLDNFEQILGATSLLAKLLSACPELMILVTSRVVLHLEGEQEFPVSPLVVPDLQHLPPQEILMQVPAVALFVQRAQAVQPGFTLTAENAVSIANLCVLLDGVPLAIVLAVARIKLFTPQALLTRLQQQRFEVLIGRGQDVPAHQQMLRDTITWSYNLLLPQEQTIFRQLCVFVGGFTLEAAEAICTIVGTSTTSALEMISSLVDHSLLLVREQHGGERRLRLLEMIREYGLERLKEASELEQARDAHAAYYLELSERAEPALYAEEQVQRAEQLRRDYENIRAAIGWLLESHEIEKALRLVTALVQFWLLQNYISEGRRFLTQAMEVARIEKVSSISPIWRRALFAAGYLAFTQNDPGQAIVLFEESERLSRHQQDKRCIARSLIYLGMIRHNRGEVEKAEAMHEEALRLSREVGVTRDLAELLVLMGFLALVHGAYAQAHEYLDEGLDILKVIGDVWGSASTLFVLGWVAYEQRAYVHAQTLIGECLAQFRTLGKPDTYPEALILYAYASVALGDETTARIALDEALSLGRELQIWDDCARAHCGLGHLALRQGDLAQARASYEESITLVQGRWLIPRLKWMLASSLEGLGEIALAEGQAAWTVRLYASADAVRAAHGYYSPLFIEQPYYDRTLVAARALLSETAFAAAWEEGQAMTPQEVITAGADTQPLVGVGLDSRAKPLPGRASANPDGLTTREVEVLRLLAQGLSNNEIAELLVLSPYTVNKHTQSIYGKLAINSRSAATRYAIEHRLL
jgi:predicted ATPase/DNA-binding NarL/FixJ family response regulator